MSKHDDDTTVVKISPLVGFLGGLCAFVGLAWFIVWLAFDTRAAAYARCVNALPQRAQTCRDMIYPEEKTETDAWKAKATRYERCMEATENPERCRRELGK